MGRKIENRILMPNPCARQDELYRRLRQDEGLLRLRYGYLGASENLQARLREDATLIASVGLNFETLARAIEVLFETDDETVNGNQIIRRKHMHSPMCPWGDFMSTPPLSFASQVTEIFVLNRSLCPPEAAEYMIANNGAALDDYRMIVDNDWAMIFSDLHPHLIRDHCFLEGIWTPYRVNPERAKMYLGL